MDSLLLFSPWGRVETTAVWPVKTLSRFLKLLRPYYTILTVEVVKSYKKLFLFTQAHIILQIHIKHTAETCTQYIWLTYTIWTWGSKYEVYDIHPQQLLSLGDPQRTLSHSFSVPWLPSPEFNSPFFHLMTRHRHVIFFPLYSAQP